MLYSLQYLRAAAAFAVAFFHFRPLFVSAGGSEKIAGLADWGHAGVPIFFVIAGFVMVWSTRLGASPVLFLMRRFVRIYGGYLPIAFVFFAYKASITGIEYWVPGGINIWGSLLLIETDPTRLLIYPAWSLPYELLFYVFFAACLLTGPKCFIYGFAGGAVLIALVASIGILPTGLHGVVGNPININFALGVIAGMSAMAGRSLPWWVAVPVGTLLLGYGLSQGDNENNWPRVFTYGVGLSILLPMLTKWEVAGLGPRWRGIALLGDASYSLYLLHAPVIFVLQTTAAASYIAWYAGPAALALFYLLTITVLSIASFTLIEKPLQTFARRHWSGSERLQKPRMT